MRLGADLDRTRQQVVVLLHGYQGQDEAAATRVRYRLGGVPRRERRLLPELLARLDSVETRLAALEQRVGAGPDLRDLDEEIRRARRDKEAAIDAEDFETAAVLRDKESRLLEEKDSRQQEWAAAHRDLPSLSDEVEHLRGLLRQHGIEPHDGAA